MNLFHYSSAEGDKILPDTIALIDQDLGVDDHSESQENSKIDIASENNENKNETETKSNDGAKLRNQDHVNESKPSNSSRSEHASLRRPTNEPKRDKCSYGRSCYR